MSTVSGSAATPYVNRSDRLGIGDDAGSEKPGAPPPRPGTRVASAAVLLGPTSTFTLGLRKGVVGWSYAGPTFGSLKPLSDLMKTGRASGDIALTYYGEIDAANVDPSTAFGKISAALTKSTGLVDFSLRVNMSFRPTTDQERAAGKGPVALKSLELTPAYENAPNGFLPPLHPSKNAAANFVSAAWTPGQGWRFSATAASAVVTLLPGHGKTVQLPGGRQLDVAHVGYAFNVPLPAVEEGRSRLQTGAVTEAVSVLNRSLGPGLKPVETFAGGASRFGEAKQIAASFDAALVHPDKTTPGTVVVARNRLGVFDHQTGLGVQLEGNGGVIALTPDGTDTLNFVAPDGKVLASGPYSKFVKTFSELAKAGNAVLNAPATRAVDTMVKGFAVKTVAASTVNAGRAVLGQIGRLLGERQMTAAGDLAERAVKDGVASWEEIGQAVGWDKLADAVGGWAELAGRVQGGWGTVAKGVGGWSALAERAGGFSKLAGLMKGWGELAAEMKGWGNLVKAMGGIGNFFEAVGGASGALEAMGEAAFLGLGVEGFSDVKRSDRLDRLNVNDPQQAREALGLIGELRDSTTRKLVDAATYTNPLMPPDALIRTSLDDKERQIYALHPDLRPPEPRSPTQGAAGTDPSAPTPVRPTTGKERRDTAATQQRGASTLRDQVQRLPGFGDEAHFRQRFDQTLETRLRSATVASQIDGIRGVQAAALAKVDPHLLAGLRTTDGRPLDRVVGELQSEIGRQADSSAQLIRQRESVLAGLQASERQHADHRSAPKSVTDPTTGRTYVDSATQGSAVEQWGRTLPQVETRLLQGELTLLSKVAQLRSLQAAAYLQRDDQALRLRLPQPGSGAADRAQGNLATLQSLTGELERLRQVSVELQGRADRAGSLGGAAGALAATQQSAASAVADPDRKRFRDADGTGLGYGDLWRKVSALNAQIQQKTAQLIDVQAEFNANLGRFDASRATPR